MLQNNCDGSGPHLSGEVRVLPIGAEPASGNVILCRACYDKEISWRIERNRSALFKSVQYVLPRWDTLAVYLVTP